VTKLSFERFEDAIPDFLMVDYRANQFRKAAEKVGSKEDAALWAIFSERFHKLLEEIYETVEPVPAAKEVFNG